MKRALLFLLMLLPLLAVAARGATRSDSTSFSPVMTGVVLLPDGRPAADVTLEAAGDRDDSAKGQKTRGVGWRALFTIRTDGHGRYQADLAPGGAKAPSIEGDSAEFHCFLISPQGAGWAPLTLEVSSRHAEVSRDIRLRRGDQIHGTVVAYPGGKPLPGAKVYAIMEDRLLRPVIVHETEADQKGRFAIPTSLPPGEYIVGAAADGYGFLAEDRRKTGRPGTVRELTLRLIRDFHFRGQVLGADGVPLRNRPVTILVDGDGSNVRYPRSEVGLDTRTDAEGRFAYVFQSHEMYVPLSRTHRHLIVRAKTDSQVSNRVTVDATKVSEAEVVLKMR